MHNKKWLYDRLKKIKLALSFFKLFVYIIDWN